MDIALTANTPNEQTGLTEKGTYRFYFNADVKVEAEAAPGVYGVIWRGNQGVINGLPGTKLRFTCPYAAVGKLDLIS